MTRNLSIIPESYRCTRNDKPGVSYFLRNRQDWKQVEDDLSGRQDRAWKDMYGG